MPRSDDLQPEDLLRASRTVLGDAEFETLRRVIYDLSGIALDDSKRSLLESRIARRLAATGLASFGAYCTWFCSGAAGEGEARELINCVTTNKTDFFREPQHFEFLRERLFPELEARARNGGPKRLRLWSAACSSGEEPYTLAITAAEHFAGKHWNIKILATDIDTEVLARAQAGVYPTERVDALPAELVERHFLRGTGRWAGHHKVRPELAALLDIRRLNLVDLDWRVRGPFDAIFCRNLVIYFDRPTQDALFRRMHDLLGEQAYMFLGRPERLHFLPELYEPLPGAVYRRRRATSAGLAAPIAKRTPPATAPAIEERPGPLPSH